MKKIFALLLVALCVFSFAACGKKEKPEEPKTAVVDLKHYSENGQMPESQYALGQDADEMLEAFEAVTGSDDSSEAHAHGDEDKFYYEVNEFDQYVSINTGNIEYLYRSVNKEKGISCIISYADAYKFEIGTVSIEIKKALTQFEAEEYDADSEKIFFLPGAENISCIKYSFENNDIVFVFVDNALSATVIYDNNEWSF